MEKQYFVYITTNLINNKKYIGYHYGLENDNYLGSGVILQQAIEKYGKHNFIKQVLQYYPNEKEAKIGEIKWINKYNAVQSDNFYNLLDGGQGNIKFARAWIQAHPQEAQKFLLKAWQQSKKWRLEHPEESKKNMLKAIKASQEWYKQHPDKRKENGKKLQQWHQEHPKQSKIIMQENAKKVNEWYKKHPEARQKQHQAAMEGYKKWKEQYPEEYKKVINKIIEQQGMKIRCITTGLEFRSQSEAARYYGMSSTSHLSACLNGKRKHAGKLSDGTKLEWEKI